MTKVRPLNRQKYNISKHRFMELYHFCLQYQEWRDELKFKTDTVKSLSISDMPGSRRVSDSTGDLAIRRAELYKKCELIEQTAIEADDLLYPYILKGVTMERMSYNYLQGVMDIPCSKNTYYDRRRKFYWLLDKKYKFGTQGTE